MTKRERQTQRVKKKMTKTFPNLTKNINLQVNAAQQSPTGQIWRKVMPWHFKLLKSKQYFEYRQGRTYQKSVTITLETVKAKRQ